MRRTKATRIYLQTGKGLSERLVFQKAALRFSTKIALIQIMPRDTYIREIYTRDESAARSLVQKYFQFYPKDRYETEVESWRRNQSQHCEFTLKRLREPKGNEKNLT